MNIFLFEFKRLRKSILIWGLAISFGLVFYMAFFPAMVSGGDSFEAIMSGMDERILAFMGMNVDLPVFKLLGYFGLTFSMIQIPIAIQASNYGFHILSVEERELTADFLLSKPVSRKKILLSKFFAALLALSIVNVIIWISSIVSLVAFKGDESFEMINVIILLSSIVFFQMLFLGVGMLISVAIKKVSSVLSFSMALGFGFYIISSLGSMLSSDFLKLLSPYSHFSPTYILINGNYNWKLALISISIIVISFPLTYLLYKKRNIPSL